MSLTVVVTFIAAVMPSGKDCGCPAFALPVTVSQSCADPENNFSDCSALRAPITFSCGYVPCACPRESAQRKVPCPTLLIVASQDERWGPGDCMERTPTAPLFRASAYFDGAEEKYALSLEGKVAGAPSK